MKNDASIRSFKLTKEQKGLLVDILKECNDFRESYIKLLRQQDTAYRTSYDNYEKELLDYKTIPITFNYNSEDLVRLFQTKHYKYLSSQKYMLEEILAMIKANYVNTQFKITALKIKGEYILDKFVRLPLFGWVDPGFKIRRLKDVYFIISEDGIQVVSRASCGIVSQEQSQKLEEKYYDITNRS